MSETGTIFPVEVSNTTALNQEAQKQPPKSSTSINTSEASAKPEWAACPISPSVTSIRRDTYCTNIHTYCNLSKNVLMNEHAQRLLLLPLKQGWLLYLQGSMSNDWRLRGRTLWKRLNIKTRCQSYEWVCVFVCHWFCMRKVRATRTEWLSHCLHTYVFVCFLIHVIHPPFEFMWAYLFPRSHSGQCKRSLKQSQRSLYSNSNKLGCFVYRLSS